MATPKSANIVTTRIAGPASYTKTTGDTWTFSEFKNVRRVISIVHDDATAPAYKAIPHSNEGSGNTRVVRVFTIAGVELDGDNISGEYFVCTLELADQPLSKPRRIVTTKVAGPASYTNGAGGTMTFAEFKNVRRVINMVHDHATAPAYMAIAKSNHGSGNTRTVFLYGLNGSEVITGNYSTSNFVCTLELAE